jgi:hypothetical protein
MEEPCLGFNLHVDAIESIPKIAATVPQWFKWLAIAVSIYRSRHQLVVSGSGRSPVLFPQSPRKSGVIRAEMGIAPSTAAVG